MDTTQATPEVQEVAKTPAELDAEAMHLVRKYMLANAGVSLLPLPLVDFVAITGIQFKMLADLSRIYDVPFQGERVKSLVASLIGTLGTGTLATGAVLSLLKVIPGLGMVSLASIPLVSAGVTWAVGHVFIQHFASGGTFLTFNPEAVREHFKAAFQQGMAEARAMQGKTETKAPAPTAAK